MKEREREKTRKWKKEIASGYEDEQAGLASEDTRILDRSIDKQQAFDRWLWKNIALNPVNSLDVEKVVYGSAGDLKMSAVTTRRYLLERVMQTDPSYSIHKHVVWWNGYKKANEA